jgi:gliding motility-associated-like protein
MKINITNLLFVFLSYSFIISEAQNNHKLNSHNHKDDFSLKHEFNKDSLIGFDEASAWREAKANASEEWQQDRIVAVLKRTYINVKYGFSKVAPPQVLQGPCTNPGFESGTTAGWTTSESPNNNSQTMLPWSNLANTQAVVVGPGTDPNVPAIPTVPAGGGNFALRLGPTGYTTGGDSYRASQTFSVTASNSVFIYRYAVILNSSSPHNCSEQPFFNIRFEDCNNNPIPCGSFNVFANSTSCASGVSFATTSTSGNTWSYLTWQTRAFDLTSYIGQCVNVEFTVGGCVASQGAHGGYAYIDADCSPMTLNLNGNDIPVGQTSSAFCGGATTNTLCAPPGFSYSWTGPGGVSGQTGQCISTNTNGTYSVTLGVLGSACAFNPVLYSSFNSAPNPTVTANVSQPNCALPMGSATITAVGGVGAYSYNWTPAAPSNSINTNLGTNTNYTVTASDINGCSGAISFSIDPTPLAPDYTLSVVPDYVISCASPSTTITFAANPANTQNTLLSPSGSAITNTNVVVTTPGVYTYTTINTVSTCSLSGTFVITADTTKPTASYTLGCSTNTINFIASTSNPSVTLSWLVPSSPTSTLVSAGSSSVQGTYTLTANNPINGCVRTYTVLANVPQISIATTPTNNILTCITRTINANATSTPSGTIVWTSSTSTVTAEDLPITIGGTYTVTATNEIGCTSQDVITITTNTAVNVSISGPNTIPCATGSINLTANSSGGGSYTYNWSPSNPVTTGSVFTATNPNTYVVVATNAVNGCTASASQAVSFDTVDASFDASVYAGLTPLPVTFTNTSIGSNPAGTMYSWSFGDGNTLPSNNPTVTHTYNAPGNFPVILTATNGFCQDTAVRYIKVEVFSKFIVPNVFTPNGDGKNDLFTFDALNMDDISLTIYDRWGLKMFEKTAKGNVAWDGKNMSGNMVTDGTYFYVIKATGLDGSKYDLSGSVNLFQ